MADHQSSAKAPWDGRFGEQFDDEVSTSGFTGTVIGTVLVTAAAIVLMLILIRVLMGQIADADATTTPPTLATGAPPAPPLPRLQSHPEAELVAFQAQMKQRLESFGWVDETAGIAHIPVEDAMQLVLDHGVAASVQPSGEPTEEETPVEETLGDEAATP